MNLAQRVNLKMLIRESKDITKKIADIQTKCNHDIEKNGHVAFCQDCETNFGWWCPDSPAHFCHYGSPPKKNCMYCGEYSERK